MREQHGQDMTRRGILGTALAAPAVTASPAGAQMPRPFFHMRRNGDYWYVVDLKGQPVYLTGMNHLGDGSVYPFDLKNQHSSWENWVRSVRSDLIDWGFNYLGPTGASHARSKRYLSLAERKGHVISTAEWSAERYEALDYPFTLMIGLPGKPNPDVFSEEFRAAIDDRCRQVCTRLKDNPQLIGYHFTHNPPWSYLNLAWRDMTTWIDPIVNVPNSPARRKWIEVMRRIYGTIDRYKLLYYPLKDWDQLLTVDMPMHGVSGYGWVRQDQIAFIREVGKEWYRVWHESIRRYDTNHLILGDRNTVHFTILPTYILDVMYPYVDALCINMMGTAEQMMRNLRDVLMYWDKPIFPADTGARAWDGRGEKSGGKMASDEEVGQAYWDHLRLGAEHPQIIGIAWCSYWETTVHHSGVRDAVTGKINAVVVNEMRKANAWAQRELRRKTGVTG